MADLVQIKIWTPMGDWIDTQWGFITTREWINHERDRINSDPTRKAEVRTRLDKIALFADDQIGKRRIR